MLYHDLFSGINKKNIINLSSAEYAERVVNVTRVFSNTADFVEFNGKQSRS